MDASLEIISTHFAKAIKGDDFIFYCYYDKSFCCFMRPMIRTSTSSPLVKCDGIIFKMSLGFVVFIEMVPQKAGPYSVCRDVVRFSNPCVQAVM